MRFLDLHYQLDLPLKALVAKIGKNHLKRPDFEFLEFFWSICLENYYINAYYQYLESFEQKNTSFLQKCQKTKISSIFAIFSKNGCK